MTSVLRKVGVVHLLEDATTTTTSISLDPWSTNRTFEAFGHTSSGAGSAIVIIEVRNDEDSDWHTMGTITLTLGTTVAGDGFSSSAAWRSVRARVTTLTGTGAKVSVNVGSAPL